MKPVLTCWAVLFLSAFGGHSVHAMPQFWATFQQTYTVNAGTPIGRARCTTCHVAAGPPALNAYGAMVHKALNAANSEAVTPAILRSIENRDADGDGYTNGLEIAAGTLPGEPKSHPEGPPSGGTHMSGDTMPGMSKHMANTGAKAPSGSSLFPLHSFHPQIVHFPIALFLFGGFLEALGLWKRKPALREAAFLCMAAASITSFAAIATGLTAMYRNEYALSGNVLIHLVLALSATLAMAVTALIGRAAVKQGKERGGWVYWSALIIALLLVSIAGHWGGILVYG